MEIKELEPHLKDAQDELIEHQVKTEKFKNNVQEIFIDVFNQDEFAQKVDSIFNEIFQRERRWKTHFNLRGKWHLHSKT